MRPDVKLGIVLALVLVLVSGGYYFYRDNREQPVPVSDSTLGQGKPTGLRIPPSSRSGTSDLPRVTHPDLRSKPEPVTAPSARSASVDAASPGNRKINSDQTKVATRVADGDSTPSKTIPDSPATGNSSNVSRTDRSFGLESNSRTNVPGTGPSTDGGTFRGSTEGPVLGGERHSGRSTKQAGPEMSPIGQSMAMNSSRREPVPASSTFPAGNAPTGVTKGGDFPDGATDGVETHRVQSHDTLSSLAQMYYGSSRYAQFLSEQNPQIRDPARLSAGTLVRIPPLQVSSAPERATGGPAALAAVRKSAGTKTYQVRAGDSFYAIARDVLGDASRWNELFALNRDKVANDPKKLRPGQTLVLPES